MISYMSINNYDLDEWPALICSYQRTSSVIWLCVMAKLARWFVYQLKIWMLRMQQCDCKFKPSRISLLHAGITILTLTTHNPHYQYLLRHSMKKLYRQCHKIAPMIRCAICIYAKCKFSFTSKMLWDIFNSCFWKILYKKAERHENQKSIVYLKMWLILDEKRTVIWYDFECFFFQLNNLQIFHQFIET